MQGGINVVISFCLATIIARKSKPAVNGHLNQLGANMTRKAIDPNSIKLTLDRMGQTVEVMGGVINRLKAHLDEVLKTLEIDSQNNNKEDDKELEQLLLSLKDKHIH